MQPSRSLIRCPLLVLSSLPTSGQAARLIAMIHTCICSTFSGRDWMTNADDFWTDPCVKQLYMNHVRVLLNCRNVYTGMLYKVGQPQNSEEVQAQQPSLWICHRMDLRVDGACARPIVLSSSYAPVQALCYSPLQDDPAIFGWDLYNEPHDPYS
jgi:hypothetical protein